MCFFTLIYNFMYLKQTWNQSPTWISSTSSKYLEPRYGATQSWCNLSSLVQNNNIKFIARTTALQWCCWQSHFSQIFKRKGAPKEKNQFLLLATLSVFWYSRLKTKHKLFKLHPYTAKASSCPEHFKIVVKQYGKLIFLGVKA